MTTVVFSGHMIDAPDRDRPRFPPRDVPRVTVAIRAAIADVVDPRAEAVAGAACGADLLFCEAWLAGERRLTVFLPRAVEPFLEESVRFAGTEWEEAFDRVAAHPLTTVVGAEQDVPEELDPHTTNNVRMLERARRADPPLHGIFVWDGGGGDGPGGTRHMVSAIERAGGDVTVIEP